MGCVSMLAAITHQNENYLAYWLDAYYQARRIYEVFQGIEPQREAPAAPPATEPEAKPEAKPAPKPKAEPKKAEPAKQLGKIGNHNAADAARYKREILERLKTARDIGVTAPEIAKAAGGCSVTADDVFMILNGQIRNISVYRDIERALDKLNIQH